MIRVVILLAAFISVTQASDWSEAVPVLHDFRPCVSYKARIAGDYLVVQASIEPAWHTFSMDNERRAKEKLAGKQSLGIDAPTEIRVSDGLAVVGPWYQSLPKEFSKPELHWFSWGFENQALFMAKVRRARAGSARLTIRGQACTETVCKQVDVALSVPLGGGKSTADPVDLKSLVRVRSAN